MESRRMGTPYTDLWRQAKQGVIRLAPCVEKYVNARVNSLNTLLTLEPLWCTAAERAWPSRAHLGRVQVGLTARDMSDMGRLAQLAANPSGTSREEIYLAVASLYRVQGAGLDERERELMREILRRLAGDVEMAIRTALADGWPMTSPPRTISLSCSGRRRHRGGPPADPQKPAARRGRHARSDRRGRRGASGSRVAGRPAYRRAGDRGARRHAARNLGAGRAGAQCTARNRVRTPMKLWSKNPATSLAFRYRWRIATTYRRPWPEDVRLGFGRAENTSS